jgi:hypothetical protein
VSEDKSADAAGAPSAPVTHSDGEAPPTNQIPRQTVDDVAQAAPADTPASSDASTGSSTASESPTASTEAAAPAPVAPAPTASAPAASAAPAASESAASVAPTAVTPAVGGPTTPAEPVQVLAAPPKRRRGVLGGAIFAVVVIVLLGAIGYLVYSRLTGDPTKNAQAGQCLANLPEVGPGQDQEAPSGKVVDCGDSSAVYQIESRLDNQTSDQAKSVDVCKASPEATVIYRAVPDSGTGYVLCLKKLG